ncbi:uncharacterized protein LOC144564191 isoform X2 [Carex rostrata]
MLLTTYASLLLLAAALLSFSHGQTTHAATTTTTTAGAATSVYDALQSHGLPRGLLPRGIESFTVNSSTGRFEATIEPPCTATFYSDIHYNRTITGTLSYGEITSISGISALELFIWFPVLEIRVDVPSSGLICFDVGVVYKRYPLSLFELPPLCTPDSSPSISLFISR